MSGAWSNFIIVIIAQLLLFLVCAFYERKISEIPHILKWSIVIAIIVGIPFDLIVGKFFSFHSFALGFGILFLIINSIFSYGLFVSHILLLQNVRLPHFIFWNILIITVYEITNIFFPVWIWKFILPPIEFILVLLMGYLMGAILTAIIFHLFIKRRFLFIDNLFKKLLPLSHTRY